MHHLTSWSVRRLWCAGFVPVCLILLLLLAMTPALAQDVSRIVSGTVADPTDSVIPGALVKLTQTSTGATKTLTGNANGSFAAHPRRRSGRHDAELRGALNAATSLSRQRRWMKGRGR